MSVTRLAIGAAALLGVVSAASAAVSFTGAYVENFDSMGPTGTTAPADWTVGTISGSRVANGGGAITTRTIYVDDGTGGVPNGTTAVVGRSFNVGSAGATDRAIGSAATTNDNAGAGIGGGDRVMQVALTNNTSSPITELTIGYTGEQWRFAQGATSSGPEGFFLFYSTAPSSGWVSVGLDFVAPHQTPAQSGLTTHTALNGNASANRLVLSKDFTLPEPLGVGQSFYFRWHDWNDNSTSDHLIAIDDVSISLVPEPASLATLLIGGLLLSRRRSR